MPGTEIPTLLFWVKRDWSSETSSNGVTTMMFRFKDLAKNELTESLYVHFLEENGQLVQVDRDEVDLESDTGMSTEIVPAEWTGEMIEDPAVRFELQKALARERGTRGTTHYVFGDFSFWDTRPDRSDATGSRRKECLKLPSFPCDAGDVFPNGDICCFVNVPYLRAELREYSTGNLVDTYESTKWGGFILADANWVPDKIYDIYAVFEHEGYPLKVRFTASGPGGPTLNHTHLAYLEMPYTVNHIGEVKLNEAGDLDSTLGDRATEWTSIYEVTSVLEEESETRLRRKYNSTNAYDEIVFHAYINGFPASNCKDYINIRQDLRRTWDVVRSLANLFHGRIVGCSYPYNFPNFPDYYDLGGTNIVEREHGSEGSAVWMAMRELIVLLLLRDPDEAEQPWIDYRTCVETLQPNENNAVSYTNTMHALWDFIDTSGVGADNGLSDTIDWTFKDLMDALLVWRDTSGYTGQNRTADEHYINSAPYQCSAGFNHECPNRMVCINDVCFAGDPHGGNVRDWVYHLGQLMGESDTYYWQTLQSNPCIGLVDTGTYGDGDKGYRTD